MSLSGQQGAADGRGESPAVPRLSDAEEILLDIISDAPGYNAPWREYEEWAESRDARLASLGLDIR